ncbi:MAG: L,D-transpeptidase family protein [Ginsengibacter sp.]
MRKLPLFFIAAIFLFSCNTQTKKAEEKNEKKDKKISIRDYSITVANSYNDLFLDSNDVASYISENDLPDSISKRITSFYNTRNYEYAWFGSDGVSEQAMGFSSLLNLDGDTSSRQKKLENKMDKMLSSDSITISPKDKSIINTEIYLTERLIRYTTSNFEKGFLKRKEVERFIPFKKSDPILLADSLINKKHKDDKYFADVSKPYKLLMDELKKYVEIVKSNQWLAVDGDAKSFDKKVTPQQVLALKRDLGLMGDMAVDTIPVMDVNVTNGIKSFQTRLGLTADGKLTNSLLKQINVTPVDRVKQLLINMNRMRWLPQAPAGNLIEVNTPAFTLVMYDGAKKVFDMAVVVGKEGHNTTLFSDFLTTIVFSPYWNVPSSIVKSEIVPGINKNPNYIQSHNMEITGQEGGLPVVRQKPGPENSLGKVKFLFPNSFNIYFHDTPAKALFQKDVRAYSHGCIRLSDPQKLAEYLLRNKPEWTTEKILEAMNSGKEQFVKIKTPVPVFLTYYTSWVDENSKLNFREDIYSHDSAVASKMFIGK